MVLQYALKKIQSLSDVNTIQSVANSVNSNQLKNKRWLLKHLQPYLDMYTGMYTDPKIVVAAGWHGLAAHMINRNVVSFDLDPTCKATKLFPNVEYVTEKIEDFDPSKFNIIICTSCEHITDEVINNFISRKSQTTIVVLQSNNYYGIEGHINCKASCEEFCESISLRILDKHTLKCDKYDRFMAFCI